MLYLLSTSCVLTLASSLLFPLGYATAAQFLPTRTTRTSRRSSPSRRPCGSLLQREFRLCFYASAYSVSDIFIIIVINNIRTCFIISFTWYVPWYTVHSVVYTCDLILARIWLLDLCPFINRVLQYVKHMGHNRNRLYSRTIHCLASMEMHYVQWFLLKSVYEITDCAKN